MRTNEIKMLTTILACGITMTLSAADKVKRKVDPAFQWNTPAPITRWDEAVPLGNGLTGCLVWGEKNKLNFSLDRGDLWDNRKPKEILEAGFTYKNIQKLVKERNKREISRLSDTPYNTPYPTKLPGVRLSVELESSFVASQFKLDMKNALATVESQAGKQVKVFANATLPVTLIRCPGPVKIAFVNRGGAASGGVQSGASVSKLGYDSPKTGTEGKDIWWKQETPQGLAYGVYVAVRKVGNETLLAVSFTATTDTPEYMALAKKRAKATLKQGFKKQFVGHRKWWHNFWAKSDIELPDPKHERYYNLMQYYYGSASRKGAPPMPLQGVWTADTAGLPPWKGDYHHDMNTQMIYWSYYTSGRYECGESLIDFQLDLAPVHRKFAKDFYGVDGIAVPGVMGFDGQPLGGWAQYALSPTMGLWLLQSYYWHWRYTMDKKMLRDRIYPYCHENVLAVEQLLVVGKDGKLELPLSTSPEIHENSIRAWLMPNTNNDLAKLHWMCDVMVEMATELNLPEDVKKYTALGKRFAPLAVNKDKVLRLSPNEDLTVSHRHHSHLMAIYPLGTLNVEQGAAEKEIVLASLDNLEKLKFGQWVGFSFSWAGCLEARAGRPEAALKYLDKFVDTFTSKNGFNLNGQQRKGKGWVSSFRYRPFTLDANFGAAQVIHEMLLQSWGKTVRIFPSVPKAWKDLSFDKLRAEGGFIVTATRKNSVTTKVKIKATIDQVLRVRNNFAKNFKWNRKVTVKGKDLVIKLKAGEVLSGHVN
ncbi:MAG: glycoside hydrolase N-terminal domain-containing protein [Lentisphaeria bacterium]|nr:glycoside hydrolase N-terminal domain-containing protein [Lentisphaeria bacterium]